MAIIDLSMPSGTFVLVPSYNHAPFIEECLASVIAQTEKPRKLLVIDDGSSDDSPAKIEKALKNCPFDSELIVRANKGICATLNEGFAYGEGEYFAYLGSDDQWHPEFLAARQRVLDERPSSVLAFGNCKLIDSSGAAIGSTADNKETQGEYLAGDTRKMLLGGTAPVSPTVVYRRSALEGLSWNGSARLEDYEMYLKLVPIGQFAFDPRVLSSWRRHGSNASGDREMMLNELLAAQQRNAAALGMSGKQLSAAAAATTFRYARIALQDGDRMTAAALARRSWRGARSAPDLVKFAVRIALPAAAAGRLRSSAKKV